MWYAGTRVVVRVAAADSDGRVSVWESEEPGGTALPLHVHTREDEQMVVLEGEVSVRLGERRHVLHAGDTLALPREVPHAHTVESERARILTIDTPAGFERLFLEHGSSAGAPPPAPPREAMRAAVEQLGVRVVGPPAR